jgi:hypothetical protein
MQLIPKAAGSHGKPKARKPRRNAKAADAAAEARLDEALDSSFPASDPPAFIEDGPAG